MTAVIARSSSYRVPPAGASIIYDEEVLQFYVDPDDLSMQYLDGGDD